MQDSDPHRVLDKLVHRVGRRRIIGDRALPERQTDLLK